MESLAQEIGNKIHFEFDSAQLNSETSKTLARMGNLLKENPNEKIRMDGFTDDMGSPNYNYKLSQKRLAAVRSILMDNGARPEQLISHAHGEQMPIAENSTPEGRSENRRVEIIVEMG